MVDGWTAEVRESLLKPATYFGCPRGLAWANAGAALFFGFFFQFPGTWVPLIFMTVPLAMAVHAYAAWLTRLHPFMFRLLGRWFSLRLRRVRTDWFD